MKLAILLQTLPLYRKTFLENLSLQLQKKGIELTVIHGTSFFKKAIKMDTDPKYSAIPLNLAEFKVLGFRIVWWKGLFKSIRKVKPNIIIILFGPGNVSLWIVQLYCYLLKIKIGIWSSGFTRKEIVGFKRKVRASILNFFLRHAKFHICYGTQYKKFLLNMGISKSKVFVAQNTLNVEPILALDLNSRKSKSSPKLTDFLFVGALIKQKNLDLAIKAIARLKDEGYNIRFTIIGQGTIIDSLKSVVSEENMEEDIFVLGPKYGEELSTYFIEADIFLLPGTGGLAINEAMAYGLPIISTIGDGTVLDLVYEDRNGYYLDEEASIENIYLTCRKAMKNSKSKLMEMGVQSKQIIIEKATSKNMVSSFESAILYGIK
jgi:glycosyltransferase involved in cell wall biosynthesis